MGSWNDFNDAQSNSNLIPKGTLAKVRLTIRPGGFDDASQGWTGGYATRGSTGAVYLNGEFTVTEGQYARRKIFTLIGLHSPKGPDWANMGRSLVVRFRHLAPIATCPRPNVGISRTTSNYKFLVAFLNLTFVRRGCGILDTNVKFTPLVRGMLNSARGISDKDMSPEAQAARRISGFADLDGIEFVARIDIGTDASGDDKNEIRAAVTPDHRDYAALMGTAGLQFGGAGNTPQQPATATQPSQPASAPGAAGRPSWA